jgi:predicted ribosome quality control (RQC) complex YloA/Tae2 family protein
MPLILGSFTVTFLARELDGLLRGSKIKGAYISDDRVLSISFRAGGGRVRVIRFLHAPGFALLSVDRQSERESEFTHLPRFESLIQGATISEVRQADLDRVVEMDLRTEDRAALRLIFELNPSLPNLFLTDGDGNILAILLRAGTRTRSRRLDVGRQYTAQPVPCKMEPHDVTREYADTLSWRKDDKVLSQCVTGVGPFLSKEVVHRATERGSLFGAFDELMSAYRRGRAEPCTFSVGSHAPGKSPTLGISWYRPRQDNVADLKSAKTLNDAALEILNNLTVTLAFDRRKQQIAGILERDLRKLKKAEAETASAEREREAARLYKKYAELIMANLDGIRKGDKAAMLPDLHEGGDTVVKIPLKPDLNPQRNAQRYFKMARKSGRRAELAREKLEAARGRLTTLESIAEELRNLTDARRLTEIEERVLFAAGAAAKEKPPEDEKAARLGIRPRRYEIAGGWTVLVGRTASENDTLTHRYAAPSDLWFHARQAQGAHVVLRREKGKTQPPKQVILEAASIAAYYSKARTSTHVPVSYTEKRYVKKVRKGPPGMAAMLREKVLFVDPKLPGARSPQGHG